MERPMKTSFTWGGLLPLALLCMAAASADSQFHALDNLSQQETGTALSRLDDSALDRVEGGLDIASGSVDLASQQAVMQAVVLESTMQAANGTVTEKRVDRATSLFQVCSSPPCTQSWHLTTSSHL
jgi:hypothetical protein